jgi:predicted ATPase
VSVTSFVGRERELAEVTRLLADTRLVTLTGTGGSGKTRLARRVAVDLVATFEDRAAFVPLAATTDASLAGSAILQALGVPDISNVSSSWERLARHLGDRRLLLVLDNLEQISSIGPELARLIERCPDITILATSRAALRVYGEHEYVVAPFAPPAPGQPFPPELVGRNDAVRLFVERARAVRPDFALTEENAAAVAAICRRLDGLPLAIELAAARVRLFGAAELLRRLDHRLTLLTGGAQDRPARQQTLRAALDWSYDLLSPAEQALFRQLVVFVNDGTYEAAEVVCNPDGAAGLDVLGGIDSLVGKSLLTVTEGGDATRFGMLETTREYALERLSESGPEEEATRARHAAYYATLTVASHSPYYTTPTRPNWLALLEPERDNLRAALRWFVERGDVVAGVPMMAVMSLLWSANGPLAEGREWLERFRALPGFVAASPEVRVRALIAEAHLELRQDATATRLCGEDLLALGRAMADPAWVERALCFLAWSSLELGELGRAEGELADRLALARELGKPELVVHTLILLGDAARLRGEDDLARARYEESLAHLMDPRLPEQASRHSHWQLRNLGHLAVHRGELAEARSLLHDSLTQVRGQANTLAAIEAVVGFASLAAARGAAERAALLLGAVDAALLSIGVKLNVSDGFEQERTLRALHATLSETALAQEWAEGQALTLEQAIAFALEADSG